MRTKYPEEAEYKRHVIYKAGSIKSDGSVVDRMLLKEFPTRADAVKWLYERMTARGMHVYDELYIADEFKHMYTDDWEEINFKY